jgi:hypothetical protein
LYQGTALVGPLKANKDLGFSPCAFSFAPAEKHLVQDVPQQGLKPNSLLLIYGPAKVVP